MSLSMLQTKEDVIAAADARILNRPRMVESHPNRSITGKKKWSNAEIRYDINVPDGRWLDLTKSYFRMRGQFYDVETGFATDSSESKEGAADGLTDEQKDALYAPVQLFPHACIDSVDFRIGQVVVSDSEMNYAQTAMLKQRMYKNQVNRDELYNLTEFDIDDFNQRRAEITALPIDEFGDLSHADSNQEFIFQPKIGIFERSQLLPPGRYQIVIRPSANLTTDVSSGKEVIPSGDVEAGDAGDTRPIGYDLDSLVFYSHHVHGELTPDDYEYAFQLNEIRCMTTHISGAGLMNYRFTVKPGCDAITLCYQSRETGGERNSVTFLGDYDVPERHKSLNSLQITYAGLSKPDPAYEVNGEITNLRRLYYDYLLNSGQYFGLSSEDYDTWMNQGPLFNFQFVKPVGDRSTHVSIKASYDTPQEANLMLFDHHSTLIEVEVKDGKLRRANRSY